MCERMISDENRTEIVNLIWDKIHARKMFSKYDIYVAAKEEGGITDLPNYFKVKKEITGLINSVIDEAWDEDIEYLRNFVTIDGKTFAVFYPSDADVEDYPEWNDVDHSEDDQDGGCDEDECDEDCENCPHNDEWDDEDDDQNEVEQFETIELSTDFQGRVYITKEDLEKIGITDEEYVAVTNYGAEVAVAVNEDVLSDSPNEIVWLKRVRGNSGLLISMKNRFLDDSDPDRVSIDIDTDNNMLHIFLAD